MSCGDCEGRGKVDCEECEGLGSIEVDCENAWEKEPYVAKGKWFSVAWNVVGKEQSVKTALTATPKVRRNVNPAAAPEKHDNPRRDYSQ